MSSEKNENKKQKGITLIAVVITVILMLILATITINVTLDGGLFGHTKKAKMQQEKTEYVEQINIGIITAKGKSGINNANFIQNLKTQIDNNSIFAEAQEITANDLSLYIKTKEGYEYTILDDETVVEGKMACLDIANGEIEIYSDYYMQAGEKNNYNGKYIITGTTTENFIHINSEGNFEIVIKNLNIDLTNKAGANNHSPIDANYNKIATNLNVKIILEGKNTLKAGTNAPGLGFAGGTANINGVTNGSKLIIEGNGELKTIAKGMAAALGSGYSGLGNAQGAANNIIINSGKITATTGMNACAIGGGLRKKASAIIINGGDIVAQSQNRSGIGSTETGEISVTINGGNITTYGGEYGSGICADIININGGIINSIGSHQSGIGWYSIANESKTINIKGGTIKTEAEKSNGIGGLVTGTADINFNFTGGNIWAIGASGRANVGYGTTEIVPKNANGTNVYLTTIALENINKTVKIKSLTASDNISYGTQDMYTTQEGKVYLYLPEGTRTIVIETEKGIYSGTVGTKAGNNELTTLNKK